MKSVFFSFSVNLTPRWPSKDLQRSTLDGSFRKSRIASSSINLEPLFNDYFCDHGFNDSLLVFFLSLSPPPSLSFSPPSRARSLSLHPSLSPSHSFNRFDKILISSLIFFFSSLSQFFFLFPHEVHSCLFLYFAISSEKTIFHEYTLSNDFIESANEDRLILTRNRVSYGILRSRSSWSRLLLLVSCIDAGDASSGCSPPLNSNWPVLSPLLEPHSPSTNLKINFLFFFYFCEQECRWFLHQIRYQIIFFVFNSLELGGLKTF